MKTFKILLTLLVTLIVLSGCSNKKTSRLYFDSTPYNYITGTNGNHSFDILFYKLDGLNRFYLQEKNLTTAETTEEVWGGWEDRNGIYHLTGEDGRKVVLSGSRSYPHIVSTDIPRLSGADLQIAKNLYLYEGVQERDGSTYEFDLRLFEQGKTIPIYLVPPQHQENTFVLRVKEMRGEKLVSEDEFIGYWNTRERILFLKMQDDFLYFKTQRDRLQLISYDNRYDLDSLDLYKVK